MSEITRILCPVDFSEPSRHALDHAVALARWFGAKVSVLHVHQLTTPTFAAGPYVGLEGLEPMSLTDVERGELLQAVNEFVAPDRAAGIPIDTLLHEDANVPGAIIDHAEALGADLVTMGTHGRSGFERLMLGSVAEKVLRRSTVPVLTVPPRTPDAVARTAAALERILCPVDFSESSAAALASAVSMASKAGASLTVLHVVELLPEVSEMPTFDVAAYRTARFDDARARLATMMSQEPGPRGEVQSLLLAGKPSREIVRLATEQQAGLIVMGVRGKGVVDRLLFGSTTHHVVQQATCPVLTVHPRQAGSVRPAAR